MNKVMTYDNYLLQIVWWKIKWWLVSIISSI